MTDPDFSFDTFISFGDCDPAGIVFYPNFFGLFDRTFHAWLIAHGGHLEVCAQIGAKGIGLMEASGKFRAPLVAGDEITVALRVEAWGSRALTLGYQVVKDGRVHALGTEVRAVFLEGAAGMKSGDMAGLKRILGGPAP